MNQTSIVGLFAGLLLGLALALDGFGAMLVCALFGFIGVIVARVLEGELDLGDYVNRSGRSRG